MSVFTNEILVDGTVVVDGSAVTQPISAATLPLPAGAATNAAVVALTKPSDIQLVDGSAHTQPVSGTFFQATQPVSGTVAVSNPGLTDTELRATPVPVSGSVSTTPVISSTATITRVATSATSTTLLAANASRKKAIIMTETGATQYVALGSAATITNYSYLLGTNMVLEISGWTGSITLVRSSGTGNVQVTELV